VLAKFGHIDAVPASSGDWGLPTVRSAPNLARTLQDQMKLALLFRSIATVAVDVEVGTVDDWKWTGPGPDFREVAAKIGFPDLADRADRLAARLANS